MPTDVKTQLREALERCRVVILSGPLGSDMEKLANQVAEELWPNHLRSAAVHFSNSKAATGEVVLHELERLLGAKDRSAFLSLLNGTHKILITCDRDWLQDVQSVLLDRPFVVISLPEVVELPYVRELSARLSEKLPLSAREFRERLRKELPNLGKAMAHPLIVKWSLMEWLDEQYRTHSRCIRLVTAEQSITFHFRRALRAWVEETAASDLEESVRLFLACLRDKRIRPAVKYDVLKVLFQSNSLPDILDRTRSDLYSNSRALLKEIFQFIKQERVPNTSLLELVRFLDRNKVLFDSYDHRWVLDILHYWFQGVTDEDPYPDGSEEAASLAKEWLERFDSYELQAPFKECLKLLARIPLHSKALLERIEAARRYDLLQQVTREEPSLLPILKRDLPELALFRAKPPPEPVEDPPPKPAEKPPRNPPKVRLDFRPPSQQPGDALVRWARARLVDGIDGDRPWQSVLEEAMELEYYPSDLVSRVGVRLVAAICARHRWSETTQPQREWILGRLEESLLQSFDDWSVSNQAQKFFFSPDRQSARAVVALLGQSIEKTHRRQLLKLLPHSLFHPSEEVRRYTALALGSNRRNLDPELIARCASAIVEEDHLRSSVDRHTLSWELCKTFLHRAFDAKLAGRTARFPETRLRLKLLAHSDPGNFESEFEIDRFFAKLEGRLSEPRFILQALLQENEKTAAPKSDSSRSDSQARPFWERLNEGLSSQKSAGRQRTKQTHFRTLHFAQSHPRGHQVSAIPRRDDSVAPRFRAGHAIQTPHPRRPGHDPPGPLNDPGVLHIYSPERCE